MYRGNRSAVCGIGWVHAYFDINLDILWRTAREELPMLIAHLETALSRDME